MYIANLESAYSKHLYLVWPMDLVQIVLSLPWRCGREMVNLTKFKHIVNSRNYYIRIHMYYSKISSKPWILCYYYLDVTDRIFMSGYHHGLLWPMSPKYLYFWPKWTPNLNKIVLPIDPKPSIWFSCELKT